MSFTIEFYRWDESIGVSPWQGDLNGAKNHAQSYLRIHKAHRVVVRDGDGDAVFVYEDEENKLRASMLADFGLPNRKAFEAEPHRDDFGIWRIKISYPGDPTILMGLGGANKLAAVIRRLDNVLADQLTTSVEAAKRAAGA